MPIDREGHLREVAVPSQPHAAGSENVTTNLDGPLWWRGLCWCGWRGDQSYDNPLWARADAVRHVEEQTR